MNTPFVIFSCISLLLTPTARVCGADGGDPKPSLSISLYAHDSRITEAEGCAFVIEVDNEQAGDIIIYGPVNEQAFNDIKADDPLPKFDPLPDTDTASGFSVAITSYMSAHTQRLSVIDRPFRLQTNIPSGEPYFIKDDASGVLIGKAENRIRATLFKDGQPVAVSNTVTITGLPDNIVPTTRDAMIWARVLPTRHLPPEFRPAATQSTTQHSQ